jgi:hypothetical protein
MELHQIADHHPRKSKEKDPEKDLLLCTSLTPDPGYCCHASRIYRTKMKKNYRI